MLPDRFQLEMKNAQEMIQQQLSAFKQECWGKLQAEASKIENEIILEKDYNVLLKEEEF